MPGPSMGSKSSWACERFACSSTRLATARFETALISSTSTAVGSLPQTAYEYVLGHPGQGLLQVEWGRTGRRAATPGRPPPRSSWRPWPPRPGRRDGCQPRCSAPRASRSCTARACPCGPCSRCSPRPCRPAATGRRSRARARRRPTGAGGWGGSTTAATQAAA